VKRPRSDVELRQILEGIFGHLADPIENVAERARLALPGEDVIVWEGDASTFQFTFVSPATERVLGYPASRWVGEATFWADVVVHKEDRDDAIAYCALATGRQRDHEFEYRALAADGRVVWLRDFVRVIAGRKGVPERLRGLMIDISDEKRSAGVFGHRPAPEAQVPPRAELLRKRS
jgi:PAS domain S-box-containing protein